METALKQRLLGAAVLVALAVTFLPMLVMDPAPESGASDVPLKVPAAPGVETRELPLIDAEIAPTPAPATTPPTDTPPTATGSPTAAAPTDMFPAPTAGGDYAVGFGSYATANDAQRVVAALQASQLPGYVEAVPRGERTLHRVRIGPYASRAEAEAARLRAAHVRDDIDAKVVVLDADAAQDTASASKPSAPTTRTVAPAPAQPTRTVTTAPRETLTAQSPAAPAAPAVPEIPPSPARTGASNVGFAVQLGAFANAADARRLQERARSAGFTAFVEPVNTERGTLHRVRIGPATDRADADRMRAEAAGKLGVSGIVRPHP